MLFGDFPNNIVDINKNNSLKIEKIYHEFYKTDYQNYLKYSSIRPFDTAFKNISEIKIIFFKEKLVSSLIFNYEGQDLSKETNKDDSSYVYSSADDNPKFNGGEKAYLNFLKKNLVYPNEALKKQIEGQVFISVVVNENGKISNIKLLRGIGGGCNEEAIRLIKMMPDWIPGKNAGKNVKVAMAIPVKFKLN